MSRKLVAYFSASGVTAKVAENLSDVLGADLFEIVPKVRYTQVFFMRSRPRLIDWRTDSSCTPSASAIALMLILEKLESRKSSRLEKLWREAHDNLGSKANHEDERVETADS